MFKAKNGHKGTRFKNVRCDLVMFAANGVWLERARDLIPFEVVQQVRRAGRDLVRVGIVLHRHLLETYVDQERVELGNSRNNVL